MDVKTNMCRLDRFIRIALGLVLIYIVFISSYLDMGTFIKVLLGIFAIINIGSGLLAFCPVYNLANISTEKKPPE